MNDKKTSLLKKKIHPIFFVLIILLGGYIVGIKWIEYRNETAPYKMKVKREHKIKKEREIKIKKELLENYVAKRSKEVKIKKNFGLNKKVYVNAESGLVLRNGSGINHEKITLIPFNSEVIIIQYSDNKDTFENTTAPWVKIKYIDTVGWVFSGFLSSNAKIGYINGNNYNVIHKSSTPYQYTYQIKSKQTGEIIDLKFKVDMVRMRGYIRKWRFSTKYIISPINNYVVARYYKRSKGYRYFFISLMDGNVIDFSAKDFLPEGSGIALLTWSEDGDYFWIEVTEGNKAFCDVDRNYFFRINVRNWSYEEMVFPYYVNSDFDLNPNINVIVFSDYPSFGDGDAGDYPSFLERKTKITLKVYYFLKKQEQIINTSITNKFNPIWVNNNTIEYNNPQGNERITDELNIDYGEPIKSFKSRGTAGIEKQSKKK